MTFEALLLTFATLSTFLQSYVVLVIWRASPPAMSTYRFCLTFFSASDLLLTSLFGFGLTPKLLLPVVAAEIHGAFALLGREGVKIGASPTASKQFHSLRCARRCSPG